MASSYEVNNRTNEALPGPWLDAQAQTQAGCSRVAAEIEVARTDASRPFVAESSNGGGVREGCMAVDIIVD